MPLYSFNFCKLSPGGNPTILVDDASIAALPAGERALIANALLHPDHLGADQVGFLSFRGELPHMEMMGGELCVNAVRSAAAVLAGKGLPRKNPSGRWEGMLSTSGAAAPLMITAREISPGIVHETAVALPRPPDEAVRVLGKNEILVRLPGITHLLLDTAGRAFPADPLAAARKKRLEHNLETENAAGVIWHAQCGGRHAILPVVHVAATESSVIESACGSASLALALALAPEGGLCVSQPSGHALSVRFENDAAWICGLVSLTARGQAHVAL